MKTQHVANISRFSQTACLRSQSLHVGFCTSERRVRRKQKICRTLPSPPPSTIQISASAQIPSQTRVYILPLAITTFLLPYPHFSTPSPSSPSNPATLIFQNVCLCRSLPSHRLRGSRLESPMCFPSVDRHHGCKQGHSILGSPIKA